MKEIESMNRDQTATSARRSFLQWNLQKTLAVAGIVAAIVVGLTMVSGLFEVVDAGEIVVRQGFFSGQLTFWKDPGPKLQLWGKCTHYNKSSQYWFSASPDQGRPTNESLKIQFNDGGHATFSGSVMYTLPLDDSSLQAIHVTFGSQDAIAQRLIRPVFEKSVYLAGQQMSSTQSYSERRNLLLYYVEDQAAHGVYRSSSRCEKQPDPVTKQEKTVCLTEIEKDQKTGQPSRVEVSPIETFHIMLSNLSVNGTEYDQTVKNQIALQQAAMAAIQTSAAEARKAEQNAITAAKNGEAAAATAKWKQEVIKAEKVTEAEQQKEVARLAKDAAEYKKQEQMLLGEGEAARKKAVMMADGALEKRLASFIEIHKFYADAFSKQALVPQIVMGSSSTSGTNATALVDLMTAATAKQLGLSLQIPPNTTTKTK
jgi:regulator of protease activity HflC (stomatin/prohibitin superfamily)